MIFRILHKEYLFAQRGDRRRAGLRVLLFAHKQMKRQGAMKVSGVRETVRDVLDMTGFTNILTLV